MVRNNLAEIKIAKERIDILFKEAKKRALDRPELSNRYVEIARKIAMKYNLKIPRKYKVLFCHHCYSFFVHGKSCVQRTYNGKIIITCLNCGKKTRYPFRKHF